MIRPHHIGLPRGADIPEAMNVDERVEDIDFVTLYRATPPLALYCRRGSTFCLIMALQSTIALLPHRTFFSPLLLADFRLFSTLVQHQRIFDVFSIYLAHCKDVSKPHTAMQPSTFAVWNSPIAKTQPNSELQWTMAHLWYDDSSSHNLAEALTAMQYGTFRKI
jgi:hypothetical protein